MPRADSADGQETTEVELPSGRPSRSAVGPRRDDVNKLREGKLGVKWPAGACLSTKTQRAHRTGASAPHRSNVAVAGFVPEPRHRAS